MFIKKLESSFWRYLIVLGCMLYFAPWKQSNQYHNEGNDKQYPYDGPKVEELKNSSF